ncbi:flagellar biosynthesis protein FlhB [Limnobacter litoralis]|uniref:Flagellar biosynthetic protein FlhB n=1 Tax=Limnobacter litoralis TaxID=481366 RepID=A0ABQ5YRJ6_9BURK|nr:flagellar biosynthesis protein FlhB [Limnobacter litoralis]GLR26712.1 flagellar biosynthesis protein FlhB [Limnobacter litoralis]
MAQEDDQERELPASEQKIRKAREEGNVPRSRELGGGLVLLSGIALLYVMGSELVSQSEKLLRFGLTVDRAQAFDTKHMGIKWVAMLQDSLLILLPLFLIVVVAAIGANVALGGFNWSTKPLEPKFSKLNPITGLKNIFSINGLAELFKAILKSVALGGVGYLLIKKDMPEFTQLGAMPLDAAMTETARIAMKDALILAAVYMVIVAMDVPYQLWRYYKGLRMNLEELKRESKESEGDPHLKAKVRSLQREAARKRMMASVPTADVVVTNPTHYAVALKYKKDGSGAPQVVAKGMGEVAAKIRELARESKVPLVEAPPLARALYANVELEREIPAALYTAVAKLLAYVYALADGMQHKVDLPTDKDIPQGLDPGAGA